jgi:hypothetical protein
MNLLQPVFFSVAALLLLAFVNPGSAESLPIRTLAKGAFSAIQEPGQEVIKDKDTWERVWSRHAAGGKPAAPLPKVDFSKEIVVVVTMGRKNTGGYSVQVTRVEPVANKLRISVQKASPPPGGMAIQALTSPFHMIAVPKSDLAPEFVETAGPEKKKGMP